MATPDQLDPRVDISNGGPLSADELRRMDAYWRAANYLSVGQIYLLDNPLLREPLKLEHVKPRLLGHWGTAPGPNLVYAHLHRVIRQRDLDVIHGCGESLPTGSMGGGPVWPRLIVTPSVSRQGRGSSGAGIT